MKPFMIFSVYWRLTGLAVALFLLLPLDPAVHARTTLDVMLVYDTTAEAWVEDQGGMEAFSANAVNDINRALQNSEVDLTFRLVHFMAVNYTTTSGPDTPLREDLEALQAGEGVFEAVHTARDTHKADVVAMLIDHGSAGGYVGRGYTLNSWNGSPDYALTVNAIQSVAISHTLTHEVGHNLGAHHAKNQKRSPGPNTNLSNPSAPYSAGWYFTGEDGVDYHTIMAYNFDGDPDNPAPEDKFYQPAELFSNPLVNWNGETAGCVEDGDNARLIRETKDIVACYRFSSPEEGGLCWLRPQQSANGSWQNEVGITGMNLLAFLNAGYTEEDEVVSKGINYLLNINPQRADGSWGSYPVYETSIVIWALKATGNPTYNDAIVNAAAYLISVQSDDVDDNNHSWYGGWGYSGWSKNNWSDLSNSQFAAMALDAAGISKADPTWAMFQRFLSRVQNLEDINDMPWAEGRIDGGFTYSPHYNYWNNYNSYGNMTASGIWGLRLSGVDVSDRRVQKAIGWLQNYYEDTDPNLTFFEQPKRGNSNRYYYYLSLAKALPMVFLNQEQEGQWYTGYFDKLKDKIASEQHPDGYWEQSQGRWRDTSFALLALQTQQPLPSDLWMAIILASPAKLLVYDPQDRVCGENECNIPEALFEIDTEGRQIVYLNQLNPGHYRFVFVGTGNGTCHLTVNGYRGDEIIRTETKEFDITIGEQLQSDVLISSMLGVLTINIEDPVPPPFIPVRLEILPDDCPKYLNTRSIRGVLPIAILGSENIDVSQIDPYSLYLEGVYPNRWDLEDVTGPQSCTEETLNYFENPDGYLDLTAKFNRKLILDAIGEVYNGQELTLTLTGNLKEEYGGTPIRGEDKVIIIENR